MSTPQGPWMATHRERRRSHRYAFDAALEMEWGSAILHGRVCDISATGMFIAADDPLWVGATYSARLALEPPLRLDCEVRRVEPGRGMAVTLVVPDAEDRARFAALLGSLTKK